MNELCRLGIQPKVSPYRLNRAEITQPERGGHGLFPLVMLDMVYFKPKSHKYQLPPTTLSTEN